MIFYNFTIQTIQANSKNRRSRYK